MHTLILSPEASYAPLVLGTLSGMSSTIQVRQKARSWAKQQKSLRKPCKVFVNWSHGQFFSLWRNISSRTEKRLVQPGMAMDINQSSPKTLCQAFVAVERYMKGIKQRMPNKCSAQCFSRESVSLIVSNKHPKIIFEVVYRASPFCNLFTEAGSFQNLVSLSSTGQKTQSRA